MRPAERAAKYIGAAYVSTLPIYNDGFTGAIGFSNADACMANINNHPGLAEHHALGRELVKLVIG
jgi:hypothetical protein